MAAGLIVPEARLRGPPRQHQSEIRQLLSRLGLLKEDAPSDQAHLRPIRVEAEGARVELAQVQQVDVLPALSAEADEDHSRSANRRPAASQESTLKTPAFVAKK